MRFTIITDTYPPEINGVAMTLERLAVGLAHLGHGIEVIRPRRSARDPDTVIMNGKDGIYREREVVGFAIPHYPQLRMALPKPIYLAALWKGLRPDAIYVATEGLLGLSAIYAARSLGIPVVSGYHTRFPDYLAARSHPVLGRFAHRYLRTLHNGTNLTLAPSADIAAHLAATGIRNVDVLGRGVDVSLFDPRHHSPRLRESWGGDGRSPIALCVGRISQEKNLPLALEAARMRGIRCVVVGDGPAEPSLRARFPEAIWSGVRRGADLAAHYASTDLFLFPSLSETYGNVLVEAMASGLVTLSFNYAAAAAHVNDGWNGFKVEVGEPLEFALKLDAVIGARCRWKDIGVAARATARELSWTAVVHRFEDILRGQALQGTRINHLTTKRRPHPIRP